MNKLQISIQSEYWIMFSFLLILFPASWLLSWILAASVHEIFHLTALRICKYQISGLRIGLSGAEIETDMEPGIPMAICALAGPLSGFMLLAVVHIFPKIAICGLIQSLCNLLPIYPLDGGRVVTGIVHRIFEKKAAMKISFYIEKITIVMTALFICYAIVHFQIGFVPAILLIVLFTKKIFLANHCPQRYNKDKREQRGYFYDRTDSAYFTNNSKTGPIYRRRV